MITIRRIAFNNSILKNFSVLTLSNALNQFLFIFTSIKIARSLNPLLFGTFNLLQLHNTIFVVIASFGLRNIIIRTIARDKTSVKKVFLISVIIRAIGFLISVILFFIYFFLNRQYDCILFILVILSILSNISFDIFESVAFGLEKMEFSGIISFLSSLGWFLLIIFLPKRLLTLHLIFGLSVLVSLLKTIIYCYSLYRADYIKGYKLITVQKHQVIQFSKECFPYYYLALFTLLSNQIPLLFLEYRSGIEQIGFFNIASKILMPINLVLTTALAAIFPNLSRLYVNNYVLFIRNVKIIFILITSFGIAGAFGVTLFRQEVIYFLYGEKYMNSSLVLGYQIWYVALYSGVCLIGTILGAINKQKELSYLSIVCTIIQVPILWYGSKYGAEYLSAAFLVATAVVFSIHVFVIHSYLKNELPFIFYFKIVCLYVLSYFIALFTPIAINFIYKVILFLIISFLSVFLMYKKYKKGIQNIFSMQ